MTNSDRHLSRLSDDFIQPAGVASETLFGLRATTASPSPGFDPVFRDPIPRSFDARILVGRNRNLPRGHMHPVGAGFRHLPVSGDEAAATTVARFGVNMTRLPSRRRMPGTCAQRPLIIVRRMSAFPIADQRSREPIGRFRLSG